MVVGSQRPTANSQKLNMLKIENLHATVGDKEILQGINLEVKAGEVHAIMGPNGTGKSTLARVIMGDEKYELLSGNIFFDDKDKAVSKFSPL